MPDSHNNPNEARRQIVTINDTAITVATLDGQRVIPLNTVDQVHQRPDGTAGRNFRENRGRMIQGKHFHELTSDEIRRQSFGHIFPPRTPKGILLTERGYLMLVKSFTDDLAWQVQDQLVEAYFRPIAVSPQVALSDPSFLRNLLLEKAEKQIELEAKIVADAPKLLAFDRIATADGSLCITDAAKTLQRRPKDLFDFLRSHRWIYTPHGGRGDIAYSTALQQGLMEHKTTTVHRSDGSEKVITQARITPKGLTRLAREFPAPAIAVKKAA